MMIRLLKLLSLLIFPVVLWSQHPVTFFTKAEAADVKASLNKYPLLSRSYQDIKKQVDKWLDKKVDVPFPRDPAGGYTHDQHKANYMLMFNAGILYQLTNDNRYAILVKNIFFDYAKLNPTLGKHPQATSSSPGHIFWQALNDANWLVYSGMAYDLIYNSLTASERKFIEDGAFKPEVDYLTKDLSQWFDLIHNHGVWACAGVGIVGIATQNKDYVDMALFLALDGCIPLFTNADEYNPPVSPPNAANKYGTHAKAPTCLMSNENCSFKNVGSQVTNIHHTGSMKKRELMIPHVLLNCNNCCHVYTVTGAAVTYPVR